MVRDKKKLFLLTLGKGKRSRYDPHEDNLRLQFGFFPRDKFWDRKREQREKLENLEYFVNQKGFSHGYGEFYAYCDFDGKEKLGVDCWANCWPFGGEEIGRSPDSKLLTTSTIDKCLKIIDETLQRAYNDKDLR